MGTNYYHVERDPCSCCGRPFESRHIGKSSAGWCFSLHVHPDDGIRTLDDWRARLATGKIRDEYGRELTVEDVIKVITDRACKTRDVTGSGYASLADFHSQNNSVDGPNNLMRHRVDVRHCIGHGEGTYDYIIGEFS